ncbi:hypothetical protein [Stenotrophomonas muris]|uniref:hypothetical protein n=1 Tax=Stenotrophomonas muris TaxID=2963283 RepID=UPI00383A48BF
MTSPERTFWKRLVATAVACLTVGFALPYMAQNALILCEILMGLGWVFGEACPRRLGMVSFPKLQQYASRTLS